MQKDIRSVETAMLIFFIAFAVAFIIMAQGYGHKDAQFPMIASAITGGLALWELIARVSKARKGTLPPRKKLVPGTGGIKWYYSILILFGYLVTILVAGLAIATFGYTLIMEWWLGYRKRVAAVIIAILVAAALTLSMKYGLKIPVPGGILFE